MRLFRLNRRKHGKVVEQGEANTQFSQQQWGVCESNLIPITTEHNFDLTGSKKPVSLVLTNVRSIKPRELDLYQWLNETNTDLSIVTETWLRNNLDYGAWTSCSVLNTNEYKVM